MPGRLGETAREANGLAERLMHVAGTAHSSLSTIHGSQDAGGNVAHLAAFPADA